MSAGGGAYPIVPPLPEYERRDSKDTTASSKGGKTTQELSEVQQQALGGVDAATEAQKVGTGEVRQQAERVAGIEAQGALAEQGAAAWKLAQLSSQPALDADQAVARARDNVKAQQARYASMPAPALFADSTGWDKVRKSVAMALGGIGDAIRARAAILAHQGMPTLNTVGQIIDMDVERQKAAIDKQKDSVVMSRTGLSDAEEARRQLRGDIDIKAMAMLDNAKKLTVARLAAAKMDQPAIDQHQQILALDAKKADYKSEYVKGLTTSIQSGWDKSTKVGVDETHRVPTATGGGGGVEADKNAANFAVLKNHGDWLANTMPGLSPDDVKAINRVMSTDDWMEGKGTVSSIASAAGLDSETGISPRAKEYLDRAHRAAEGLGRVQSGAAIGTVEGIRFMKSLTPRISDTPETLQMRAKNIVEDIDARGQYMARPPRNPAAPAVAPAGQPAPAAAPTPGTKPPGPPPPPAANDLRSRVVAAMKADPARAGTPAGRVVMRKYGISPEELK